MKTKVALISIYLMFVAIAVFQWREAGRPLAVQAQAIGAYGRVARKDPAVAGKISLEKLASAAQGEVRFASSMAERDRLFVVLSLLLTLPLAGYIAAGIRTKRIA